MTTVTFHSAEGRLDGFVVEGHSGYAEAGSDIVCAAISAAVGGMLKRHLAPETLERLLRNELLNDEQEEKKGGQLPLLGLLLGGGKKEEGDQL